MLPRFVRWYVNDTINKSLIYEGKIGDVQLHLWRGAYSIEDIQLLKKTGNIPVPLFAARHVDFSLQWDALMAGKLVGQMILRQPQLNFVDDSQNESRSQTGAGGPWLEMIKELFPFKINRAQIEQGSIHFRAFNTDPPVDVYLSQMDASIEDLTNIHDQITPLVTTVQAKAMAMDQGKFEYEMKLDPFSYRPTFQLAVRLLGLDVTKTAALTRAYGAFDFEHGWFDLVIELDAKEGRVTGYVKPLFRNVQVLGLKKDIRQDNIVELFWEALVGVAAQLLKNQPRDQIATVIPLRGDLNNPQTSILEVVGNILRNGFIRAYLPRFQGTTPDLQDLEFGPGSIADPLTVGNEP